MLDMYVLGENLEFSQHCPNDGPILAILWFRVVGYVYKQKWNCI